jgi:O-antigen/teichoic acid export membrane protein
MFNELKSAAQKTSIYSLGNLLPKLVGFVLLPLYTDKLSTAEYGVLAILQATMQVLIGIFSFNLHTAMLRWLAQEKDRLTQRSIVFTTFVSTLFIVLSLQLLLIPFTEKFSIYFFEKSEFTNYFVLLFISSGIGILYNVPLNIIRFHEKPTFYITITSIKFTFILVLNIYFVAFRQMGVEGIILSELLGGLLLIILASRFTFSNMSPKFNFPILKKMFSYGFPLIFSTTFSLALTLGDRYLIKFLLNESSVGVYSLGHRVASVINVFLIQSFQLGYLPIAFKKLDDSNAKRFYSKVLTYFTLTLVFAALLFSMFGKNIIEIMSSNSDYWIAYTVVPLISLAFVFKGMQYVFSLAFHFTKKTSYNAYVVIATSLLNVSLNFWLIPELGYIGAAYAMAISMFVMMLLSYIYAQKLYKINYELKRITLLLIVGLLIYAVSTIQFEFSNSFQILIQFLLLTLFPSLLFLLRFFDEAENRESKRRVVKVEKF